MKGAVREKRQVWRDTKRGDGERESERRAIKRVPERETER